MANDPRRMDDLDRQQNLLKAINSCSGTMILVGCLLPFIVIALLFMLVASGVLK